MVNEKDRFNEQSKVPKRKPTKDYVRIYKLFMQNKANFGNSKMNITIDITSKYENVSAGSGKKTKPIQTQFNPIQTQLKPIQTQNKPNIKTVLRDQLLQAQSAKMAQKLTSSNHQNDTKEKCNFLSINMLNSLIQYNHPTGTSFAYLSLRR